MKILYYTTVDHDHDKYITIQQLNNLTSESFTARLRLAMKYGISNFVKKADLNKNELSEKFKLISMKGLTKDLINKFSILNGAKYFTLGIFQNYLSIYTSLKIHQIF